MSTLSIAALAALVGRFELPDDGARSRSRPADEGLELERSPVRRVATGRRAVGAALTAATAVPAAVFRAGRGELRKES